MPGHYGHGKKKAKKAPNSEMNRKRRQKEVASKNRRLGRPKK